MNVSTNTSEQTISHLGKDMEHLQFAAKIEHLEEKEYCDASSKVHGNCDSSCDHVADKYSAGRIGSTLTTGSSRGVHLPTVLLNSESSWNMEIRQHCGTDNIDFHSICSCSSEE
mmetsp:Transcript_18362/g.26738  ORF Transcript_18362/g.26738 Transcript_18362/m.26738 type:complete len:114 (+) Transcript_18362:315-656(+)